MHQDIRRVDLDLGQGGPKALDPLRPNGGLVAVVFWDGGKQLQRLHAAGGLSFFGELAHLADSRSFKAWLAPLRQIEWVVYAKRPFAGPQAVLAYLSRYTHRVAISNGRLLALDERGVSFRWKDYRAKGRTRHRVTTPCKT